jgi:hypothetical protein
VDTPHCFSFRLQNVRRWEPSQLPRKYLAGKKWKPVFLKWGR